MSQTAYSINQNAYLLGQIIDTAYKHTEGKICKAAVPVGRGVAKVIGKDDQIRLPAANQTTLVFDADFVTDNDIDLDINGTSITTVEFDTDHDTTVAALAAEIAGNADVASATVSAADTDSRTIIINGVDNTVINLTNIAVTNGVSQASGTAALGTRDTLYGIAHISQSIEGGLPGTTEVPQYPANGVGNIMRRGSVAVYFETAFNPDSDTLYCRFIADGTGKLIGQFRNDSDSSKAFAVTGNFKVKTTLSAAGIGVIELNKPV